MESKRIIAIASRCLGAIVLLGLLGGCVVRPGGHVDVVDEHGWHHTGYYDHNVWHGGYYDGAHVYHDDPGDWHH